MNANREWLIIAAVTIVALLLRVWGINWDLWLDEILTVVRYMRLAPLEAATAFESANQHFLNSLAGSISIRLAGEAAWSVRLPALIFGTATIPVFLALARRVTDRREAIFATMALALSYHHVWFSQNARGYSAMIFFSVLSTLLLIQWYEQRGRGRPITWLCFALSSVLGMISLLNYAFVLAAHFIFAVGATVHHRDREGIWTVAASSLLLGGLLPLVFAPLLPELLAYFAGNIGTGLQHPMLVIRFLLRFFSDAYPILVLPLFISGTALVLVGLISYIKSKVIVAFMLLVPAMLNVFTLILLFWGGYPRSFLYILPFAILVAMRGAFVSGAFCAGLFSSLRRGHRFEYALPLLILVGSTAMLSYNYMYPKQDYTGALAYAKAQANPDDVIASVGSLAIGYRDYYAPDLAFPEDVDSLQNLQQPGRRVWVLYSFTRDMERKFPELQKHIKNSFTLDRVFPGTLGDGTIYLWVSGKAPGT